MIKQKLYKSLRATNPKLSIETNSNKGSSNYSENSILSNEVSNYKNLEQRDSQEH